MSFHRSLIQMGNKFISFLTYSNLWIGLGAGSLFNFFYLFLNNHIAPFDLSLFIISATIFTYNFHRRIGDQKDDTKKNHSASVQWMRDYPIFSKFITLSSFLCTTILLVRLPSTAIYTLIPLALISLLYILEIGEKRPLRKLPFLKVFLIAVVWSVTIVILPFQIAEKDFIPVHFLLLLITFSFMIAEILPFDFRDIKNDYSTALKTIPQKVGRQKTIWISLSCLIISNILFASTFIFYNPPLPFLLSWIFSSAYLAIFIVRIRSQRNDLFYSFYLEFTLILPFLLLIFFREWV